MEQAMLEASVFVSVDEAIEGANPHFDRLGSGPLVHEWRNHVPEAVQAIWTTFTREQRVAIVGWAQELASAEEWE